MAAPPPAPPHPAAPLGGRDPRPSARPQGMEAGGSRATQRLLSPGRLGQLRLAAPASAPPGARVAGRGRPLRGRWAPRTGCGALSPSGPGDSSGLPPPSSPLGCSLSFRPLFVLLALYSRCSMGPKEGGEEVPVEPVRVEGGRAGGCRSRGFSASARARCSSGALPLLPFGAPGARGEALRAVGDTPLSPASSAVSAGTPGWLLAARRAADGLLGLLVLLSLSLPSPVVVCLSTTFRPAHYNAGERRSQDKDLKGWWVEKQGSKGPSPSRVFRTKPQFGATKQSRPASQV
ncbi:translation initiation factor IF-2-like [Melozone crissalis]|uniref:translation initiation factor IF-2-like n=1 Tax=Melozone crissalis TaxID=40204 RepID=UPI0023DB02ED|nr:translation initiation factor IF-2-like [Melozone crissalis]